MLKALFHNSPSPSYLKRGNYGIFSCYPLKIGILALNILLKIRGIKRVINVSQHSNSLPPVERIIIF